MRIQIGILIIINIKRFNQCSECPNTRIKKIMESCFIIKARKLLRISKYLNRRRLSSSKAQVSTALKAIKITTNSKDLSNPVSIITTRSASMQPPQTCKTCKVQTPNSFSSAIRSLTISILRKHLQEVLKRVSNLSNLSLKYIRVPHLRFWLKGSRHRRVKIKHLIIHVLNCLRRV